MPMIAKKTEPTELENKVIDTPTATYDYYMFYKDYGFDYDSSKWSIDEADNSLNSGNYKLTYAQAIENLTSAGFNINEPNGRANFFTFLYNQFSSQADATTSVELGTSNFTLKTGSYIYYAYLDLVYETSIERCYFVLLPQEDMFVEFILSNQDTVIPGDIDTEIVDYICAIYNANEQESGNGMENEVSNTLVTNDIVTNEVSNIVANEVSNTISNGTTNNIATNEVASNTVTNTVSTNTSTS